MANKQYRMGCEILYAQEQVQLDIVGWFIWGFTSGRVAKLMQDELKPLHPRCAGTESWDGRLSTTWTCLGWGGSQEPSRMQCLGVPGSANIYSSGWLHMLVSQYLWRGLPCGQKNLGPRQVCTPLCCHSSPPVYCLSGEAHTLNKVLFPLGFLSNQSQQLSAVDTTWLFDLASEFVIIMMILGLSRQVWQKQEDLWFWVWSCLRCL